MENRKTNIWLFVIAVIVLVAGSVSAFLLVHPYTLKFWLSYAACVIALCALTFGIWSTSRSTNQPSAFLPTVVAVIYVVLVVIAVVVGNILPLSAAWFGVILLILLALYAIAAIVSQLAHGSISADREKTKRQVTESRMDTERARQMLDQTNNLPEDSREPARKILNRVEEKLRYSDPIPASGTEQQVIQMEAALGNLEATMDSLLRGQTNIDRLEQKADLAVQKIDAYNRANMMAK